MVLVSTAEHAAVVYGCVVSMSTLVPALLLRCDVVREKSRLKID